MPMDNNLRFTVTSGIQNMQNNYEGNIMQSNLQGTQMQQFQNQQVNMGYTGLQSNIQGGLQRTYNNNLYQTNQKQGLNIQVGQFGGIKNYIPYQLNNQKPGEANIDIVRNIINPQAQITKQQDNYYQQRQQTQEATYCLRLFGFSPNSNPDIIIQQYRDQAKTGPLDIIDQNINYIDIQTQNYNDIESIVKSCPFLVQDSTNGEFRFYGCCNMQNERVEVKQGKFEGYKEYDFSILKYVIIGLIGCLICFGNQGLLTLLLIYSLIGILVGCFIGCKYLLKSEKNITQGKITGTFNKILKGNNNQQ